MQYKNVLFYKGTFTDYNDNLAAGGGKYAAERLGEREFHFWHVATPDGPVYVGLTDYPTAGGGIVEVGTAVQHGSFEAFQRDIKDNPSACHDMGLFTTYTSCQGDRITYDHGKATVNGKPWPLHGYELYESSFINSTHGSGVIEIVKAKRSLQLDFRDAQNPIRVERLTNSR